jgi:hypothetical protein
LLFFAAIYQRSKSRLPRHSSSADSSGNGSSEMTFAQWLLLLFFAVLVSGCDDPSFTTSSQITIAIIATIAHSPNYSISKYLHSTISLSVLGCRYVLQHPLCPAAPD